MTDIARLKRIVTILGDDEFFASLLGSVQGGWIAPDGMGFAYWQIPIESGPVKSRLSPEFDDLLPELDLALVRFDEEVPPHMHRNSDGVIFWKTVDGHSPKDWQEGLFEGRDAVSYAHWTSEITEIPRMTWHAFRPDKDKPGAKLFGISANYPPLEDDDFVE